MSRYNQFSGHSSSWKVKGADSPAGAELVAAVEPTVLSWVAHCRLMAQQSGLDVVFKFLNQKYFTAAWQMLHGQEGLVVTVYPPPEATPEQIKEIIKEPPVESFTPPQPPPSEPGVTPKQLPTHQDDVTVPPVPPETYLLILFDNKSIVAVPMSALRDLSKAKPAVGPKALEVSDWTLPPNNTISANTFGWSNWSSSDSLKQIPVVPTTLQMTNSRKMGPLAVASISVTSGVITSSNNYNLIQLSKGLDACFPLKALSHIGDVGNPTNFPALMATDNMVYACTQTFVLDKGKLSPADDDIWGYGDKLMDDFHLGTSIPYTPNFIDSSLVAHYHTVNAVGAAMPIVPSLGYVGSSEPPDMFYESPETGFDLILTEIDVWPYEIYLTGPGTISGIAAMPMLDQSSGVDVLNAFSLSIQLSFSGESWPPADDPITVTEGSLSFSAPNSFGLLQYRRLTSGNKFSVYSAPYGFAGTYCAYFSNAGEDFKTPYGFSRGGYGSTTVDSGSDVVWPYPWEVCNALLQVSNGVYNLQGIAVHDSNYSSSVDTWLIDTHKFFLGGADVTADLENLCGVTSEKIQYIFMEVPLDAIEGLK